MSSPINLPGKKKSKPKSASGSASRASHIMAPKAVARLSKGVDDSLGFLICDTARYVKKVLYARLVPYGIPGSAWFVLRVLWDRDGISQRELSDRLGVAEPSMVTTLRVMEQLGLVTRERNSVDKRKMRIYLTRQALTLEKPLMVIAEEVNDIMLEGLVGGDMTRVRTELLAIRSRLSSADDVALDAESSRSKTFGDPGVA